MPPWVPGGAGAVVARIRDRPLANGDQVASDWVDLTDGVLDIPIDVDEWGVDTLNHTVWTNVATDGVVLDTSVAQLDHCEGWLQADDEVKGNTGHNANTDYRWTDQSSVQCDQSHRLYCVQQ